jgi:hypothetical protein
MADEKPPPPKPPAPSPSPPRDPTEPETRGLGNDAPTERLQDVIEELRRER